MVLDSKFDRFYSSFFNPTVPTKSSCRSRWLVAASAVASCSGLSHPVWQRPGKSFREESIS